MILFLDDDPNRAAIAYSRMTEHEQGNTVWCKTPEETISTLRDYIDRLSVVRLDHDLEGKQYQHSDSPDSGMEVVRWLEETSKKHPDMFKDYEKMKFVVHSYNELAAPEMVERLKKLGLQAEWVPFGT